MDQVTEHLPPDEDTESEPCAVFAIGKHGMWYCTREIGHAGRHEAEVEDGRIAAHWAQDGTL